MHSTYNIFFARIFIMKKKVRLIVVSCFVLCFVAAIISSAIARNAQPAGGTGIGVLPGGPGGRDVPVPPPARPDPLLPFYNPELPVQERVKDIVSRLELEEKIALMQMASPSIPRLGIAPYHWWTEALHGMTHDLSTVFPQAIGMSASWDTDLHFEVSSAISTEGRAKNHEYRANQIFNAMTGLDFWSPNINIFRDPRWGRGQETYGEDPYLTSRFGIAFVKGIQGDHPFYFKAIATPKHFAVHSGPESIREQFDAVVTDQDLYTTYLPQFEAAIKEAHAYSVMSSYNAVNGVPAPANKRLLTDILRKQWGFDGYVVSDVGGVADIYQQGRHAYVQTAAEASALAIKAGNELNSGTVYAGGGSPSNLAQAIDKGLITIEEVDAALGNLMEARIRMGEFDPPGYEGNPYNKITPAMYNTPEHHELALKAARKTMVLLKNDNNTLPLKTSIGTVAVLGPNADAINMQYGNYNGEATEEHQVTILNGIKKALGADKVLTPNQQISLTGTLPLTELVKAEYLFTDASKSKNGLTVGYATNADILARSSKAEVSETGALMMPSADSGITFDPTMAAKMAGVLVPPITGEYQLGGKGRDGFRLSIDGKVIVDEMQGGALRTAGNLIHLEKGKSYKVLVEFTHSASTSGGAGGGRGMGGRGGFGGTTRGMVAGGGRGGFGRGNRGGRGGGAFGTTTDAPGVTAAASANPSDDPLFQIAWTIPTEDGLPANTSGQSLYAEATELVKKADAVILVVGIDGSQEGEMRDKRAIELPAIQEGLVRAATIAAGDKPVVVVNCSGSPVAFNWAKENVPAIIQAWYPGQRGDAVADVVFGKYNPGGKLPVTFYRATSDLQEFTNYAMYNRTYRYDTKPVLYPFGYGLSYSSFEYSNLKAPEKSATSDDLKISFDVKNTSKVDGEEVVQCYINRDIPAIDPASVTAPDKMSDEQATLLATPRKTLVGFARVPLKAGESKNVAFTVTTQQLSLVVGKDGKREVRPENLQIQVGGNSVIGDNTLTQKLTLEGQPVAPKYNFIAPVIK
ncbi:MAG: glycoside hydrolase family 3 C-terminal domain-containing protein [Bacteroidales bacterium]|nr:glycoside hydrolase family 3 C-terminal domain-containing protein [Bacteroidales bacterium]